MDYTQLWFMVAMVLTAQSYFPKVKGENMESSYIARIIDGKVRHCIGKYDCPPGHEILPCLIDYTEDQCSKCVEGYVQPDYVSSTTDVNSTKCFRPEGECHARDVTYSRTANTNTCVFNRYCKCDVEQCYYGDPCYCKKRTEPCDVGETMNTDGKCVKCPPGTEKNSIGCGVCKHIPITTKKIESTLTPKSSITTQAALMNFKNFTEEQVTENSTKMAVSNYKAFAKPLSEHQTDQAVKKDKEFPLMIVLGILSAVIGIAVIVTVVFILCKKRKFSEDSLHQIEQGPLLPNQDVIEANQTNDNNNDEKNQQNQIKNNPNRKPRNQEQRNSVVAEPGNLPLEAELGNSLGPADENETITNEEYNSIHSVTGESIMGGSLLILDNDPLDSISNISMPVTSENDSTNLDASLQSENSLNNATQVPEISEDSINGHSKYIAKRMEEDHEKSDTFKNKPLSSLQDTNNRKTDVKNSAYKYEEGKTRSLPINILPPSEEHMNSMQEDIVKIIDNEEDDAKLINKKKLGSSGDISRMRGKQMNSIQIEIVKIIDDEHDDSKPCFMKKIGSESNISSMQEDIVKIVDEHEQNDCYFSANKDSPQKLLNISINDNSNNLIDQNRPDSLLSYSSQESLSDCNINTYKTNTREYSKNTNKEIQHVCSHDSNTTPKILNNLNKSDSWELNINSYVSDHLCYTDKILLDSINLKSDTMSISTERGLYSNIQVDMSSFLSSDRLTDTIGSSLERYNFNFHDIKSVSTGNSVTKPKEEIPELDSGVFEDFEKSGEHT